MEKSKEKNLPGMQANNKQKEILIESGAKKT